MIQGRQESSGGDLTGSDAYGCLVSIVNHSGIILDGMVFGPRRPHLAIVHVHGSLGNFYHQQFIRVMANIFLPYGITLLSFNLSAHDGIAEGYTIDGEMRYIGGSLSPFDSCLDDLDAILTFARTIAGRVVLQGHSLGCDRVLYYTESRQTEIPLILLSPCDSYRLHEQWLGKESIPQQVARLSQHSSEGEWQLLPSEEYGLNGPEGWTYHIPISRASLCSILTGAPFRLLRIEGSATPLHDEPSFAYLGKRDAIRGASTDVMSQHLKRLLPGLEIHEEENGEHDLEGCERSVAGAIITWIQRCGFLTEPDVVDQIVVEGVRDEE